MIKFHGLHNDTYNTPEELIEHYKPIVTELVDINNVLKNLPKEDEFWTKELIDSFDIVIDYINGNAVDI